MAAAMTTVNKPANENTNVATDNSLQVDIVMCVLLTHFFFYSLPVKSVFLLV